MARKRAPKMNVTEEPQTKAVRLDLELKDWERLEAQAKRRGLNKASTARMVILEWLDEQDAKGGAR